VHFFVDDIEADWAYPQPFDFIYMRMLTLSIDDWDRLFEQSYANLRPGGWIELFDAVFPIVSDDGSLPPDSALLRWSRLMNEAPKRMGRSLDSALAYRSQLARAGFVNIREHLFKWPVSAWPKDPAYKEIGAWTMRNLVDGAEGMCLALFTRNFGWSVEQVRDLLEGVYEDLRNKQYHAYIRM
jgi:SAM-dependent methyltransferase